MKSISMLAMTLLIIMGTTLANEPDSVKTEKSVASEESAMIDDLLEELEQDETINNLINTRQSVYEIYDSNNDLVFKGSEKQWNDIEDDSLVSMKRKAEFLLRTTTTRVYKVF